MKYPRGFLGRKGMSIMEVIVIIVIVGMLAAIAIPRFMGAGRRDRGEPGSILETRKEQVTSQVSTGTVTCPHCGCTIRLKLE